MVSAEVRWLRKLIGASDDPVQIDESRFAGHRTYNRGSIF